MHSILTKITSLTIAAVLICILSIGGIGIYAVRSEGNRHSAEEMSLLCDNLRQSIDEYLNSIEQSVDMVTRYAVEALDSVELMEGGVIGASGRGDSLSHEDWDADRQWELDTHLRQHADKVRTVFRSVANHTNGVVTYYYRINPEISMDVTGFFFTKVGSSEFSEIEPTDITAYDPEDMSHVGWYYLPLQRGRPSWIGPYDNENIHLQMVSYVTPIYKSGTFIGVIGMDISYATLISQIEDIRLFDTGYAFLTDDEGNIVYHPSLPIGLNMANAGPSLEAAVQRLKGNPQSGSTPIRYRFQGVSRQMYFNTLSNGMRLIVSAPESEINAGSVTLVRWVILAGMLMLFFFGALMAYTMLRLTEPLRRLTEAARRVSDGDYEVSLSYDGKDEVGILTASFRQLAEHLRVYISDLNSLAYQDALTGVKNKSAYAVSSRKLNDAIRIAKPGEAPEFAVVMLDCNNLKKINDQYGHEKGDIYLQTACQLICRVFTHSPVFRVGGDEFTVILQKDDYHARGDLMRLLDTYAREINLKASHPWEQVHIAKGAAVYDAARDFGVESVLHRADERMYSDKRRYKKAMERLTPQTQSI